MMTWNKRGHGEFLSWRKISHHQKIVCHLAHKDTKAQRRYFNCGRNAKRASRNLKKSYWFYWSDLLIRKEHKILSTVQLVKQVMPINTTPWRRSSPCSSRGWPVCLGAPPLCLSKPPPPFLPPHEDTGWHSDLHLTPHQVPTPIHRARHAPGTSHTLIRSIFTKAVEGKC